MKTIFSHLLLVTLILSAHFVTRADQVDALVARMMSENKIPGAAVAVIRDGKVVRKKGYGVASLEFGVPVTPQTVFEIGSVSKQMTGAAMMLLVEDGRVNLDEKISAYLPNTPEAWKNVTVRHLLTHTSGIKSYTAIGKGFELSRRLTREEFIRELAPHALEFEPGARYSYSNSGYSLLGLIIESVSGMKYFDFMRERLFKPLGMNNTSDRDPKYVIKNRATGYELENGVHIGRDYDLTDLSAAGAIVSTIDDLIKWDAAWRSDLLLKPSSKSEAWKPFTLNNGTTSYYGFGWNVADFRGAKLVSHSGSTAGFNSQILRFHEDRLSVIVLTNLGDAGFATPIARGVARVFMPSIKIAAMKEVQEPDTARAARFRELLEQRIGNKLDSPMIAETLARSLKTERTKNTNDRIASFGKITEFSLVGTETNATSTIFRYRARTAKRLFLWRFAVGPDGKITEMTLEDEE